MRSDYDCVVVGAGVVGATLGLACGGLGMRVALVDIRAPSRADATGGDPRGLVLGPASRRILETLGVWRHLAAEATPVERIHVSDQDRFGFTHLDCADVGLPALGHVCRADRLIAACDAALAGAAHCEVCWSTAVRGIAQTRETVTLRVWQDGVEREITASLLVGADGARSAVREHAGIAALGRDYAQTAIVATLCAAGGDPALALERFTRDGTLALLPGGGDARFSVRVVCAAELERVLAMPAGAYLAELAAGFGGRGGAFSQLGSRRAHHLALTRAASLTGERCALIGAAATSVHPNAAQGLNLGLRDAATLADCLADCRRSGGDIGGHDCLQGYAASRSRDHRRVAVFTDLLARGFASRLGPIAWARDAAMLAIDLLPAVKRGLMHAAMGLAGPQPRLVRGLRP